MALEKGARPLAQCLRCTRHDRIQLAIRSFSTSSPSQQEVETVKPNRPINPETVHSPRLERKLIREQNKLPIGSRRRRAALANSPNIPFIELPYQCFQEARKFLQEDRQEKVKDIQEERKRIAKLQDKVVVGEHEERKKAHRLESMRTHLEHLKILADSNDPMVKKKFEDGQADMSKPIYRHLADTKWREYERKVLMQRIETMFIVPDVLPKLDPTVSVNLSFPSPQNSRKKHNVLHGDFVDSRISEYAPQITIQPYEKGEKLYTIAVINPDVPNVAKDGFEFRSHFLAVNIPISPTTNNTINLSSLPETAQTVIPWLAPYAQKGFPYQRLAVLVFQQPAAEKALAGSSEVPSSKPIDIEQFAQFKRHEGWHARILMQKLRLEPVGGDLFRTQWDEGTAGVMQRAGVVGWDVEFKRKRIDPLPYKRLKGERYR